MVMARRGPLWDLGNVETSRIGLWHSSSCNVSNESNSDASMLVRCMANPFSRPSPGIHRDGSLLGGVRTRRDVERDDPGGSMPCLADSPAWLVRPAQVPGLGVWRPCSQPRQRIPTPAETRTGVNLCRSPRSGPASASPSCCHPAATKIKRPDRLPAIRPLTCTNLVAGAGFDSLWKLVCQAVRVRSL
jgi:hypothetical protein